MIDSPSPSSGRSAPSSSYYANDRKDIFFYQADDDHYVPRAVLIDLEPRVCARERWGQRRKVQSLQTPTVLMSLLTESRSSMASANPSTRIYSTRRTSGCTQKVPEPETTGPRVRAKQPCPRWYWLPAPLTVASGYQHGEEKQEEIIDMISREVDGCDSLEVRAR